MFNFSKNKCKLKVMLQQFLLYNNMFLSNYFSTSKGFLLLRWEKLCKTMHSYMLHNQPNHSLSRFMNKVMYQLVTRICAKILVAYYNCFTGTKLVPWARQVATLDSTIFIILIVSYYNTVIVKQHSFVWFLQIFLQSIFLIKMIISLLHSYYKYVTNTLFSIL